MLLKTDTIAALATPPGEGGIAVLRVSGPEAVAIAARLFRPARGGDPAAFPGYSVHYGRIVDSRTGEEADDGLLTLFRAPRSYTGEDMAELSCHGGRTTTARILQLLLEAGARLAEPGEFTLRAFLNGRMDLAQAEAVADLIRARTETARKQARRQLDGALSQAVGALKDELVGILAAIEVTIDFSEEVGDLDYPALENRLITTREGIERLLATAERGRILREGLRVAIIGRPNVGKSSLLNALLRYERAIVTDIAGTTRDLVEESANIGGIPVALVDTAGLRETADTVERIGVARAERAAAEADLILFVVDAMEGWTGEENEIAMRLRAAGSPPALLVVNKSDLASPDALAVLLSSKRDLPIAPVAVAHVSALTGEGLEVLEQQIVSVAAGPQIEGKDSVIVASIRHKQALETALTSLTEAGRTACQRLPGDFIAIDIRGALDALGQITGETVTEEIIHRIFQDFCVGK